MPGYDPFLRGRFPVGVRTLRLHDEARGRVFTAEVWYPARAHYERQDLEHATQDAFSALPSGTIRRQMAVRDAATEPGRYPLIAYSHHSGGNRRSATFLCTHLSSHGYFVAALDHSEISAAERQPAPAETAVERAKRIEAMIASRVPDLRYLLDAVARDDVLDPGVSLETAGIGLVGHSFGGWTALATAEQDPRIAAVVALAPAGSSKTKPGILQLHLSFARSRSVPTMYLVARDDVTLPLPGMIELFERTPGSKTMVVLSNADHLHFVDDIADDHEAVRNMPFTGELTWIPKEMRPITELCLPGHAHDFVRGLALSHFDAVLLPRQEARRFLANELARALARRHIEAYSYEPSK